ncbi:hypothetical protein B0A48_01733 [Cryoendolithus antarcticus]|uniref:Uncharacterized protein n=1 Tax=Cryoendolithus antarcticus TaxID=1507870 RepID=A0A1V8TQB7_9PEZI|nr:hypothetical protein B0A48_01733 [Cryoendolithus antarcticus]
MADPLTAVGSAAAILQITGQAWQLGKALQKFYRETQHIDETVKLLGVEVESLGDSCDLVHEQLESIVNVEAASGASAYDRDGKLWRTVCAEADQCRNTLDGLRKIVDRVKGERSSFTAQAMRQVKLNKNKENIEGIRQRIGLHSQSLQTVLQVINIRVAHLAPSYANQELRPRLDGLSEQITMLQSTVNQLKQQGASVDVTDALVTCAQDAMSSGTTLYEASVADGSIYCGRSGEDTNLRVAAWVGTLESLHEAKSSSDDQSYALTVFTDDDKYLLAFDGTSWTTDGEAIDTGAGAVPDIHDDEHYLESAMATSMLNEGKDAFDNGKWTDADQLLKEALSILDQLPSSSRPPHDTFELQYMLAACAFPVGDLAVTRDALLSLTQRMPRTDRQRIIICDARCLLSRLYVRTGELDLARVSSTSAGDGRRRLLGGNHESYFGALALSSRIYQMLDNPVRARIVGTMIPEPHRADALAAADAVFATDAMLASTTTDQEQRLQNSAVLPLRSEIYQFATSTVQSDRHPSTLPGSWVDHDQSAKVSINAQPADRDALQSSRPAVDGVPAFATQHTLASIDATQLNNDSAFSSDTLTPGTTPRLELRWSKAQHIAAHKNTVQSVRFSPDSKLIASASWDKSCKLWDTTTGKLVYGFKGDARFLSVAFSPDGSLLACGSFDHVIRVYGTKTFAIAQQLGTGVSLKSEDDWSHAVCGVAFSPDGELLAGAYEDRVIRVWNVARGTKVMRLEGHAKGIMCAIFSPDGRLIASAADDQTVRIWDVASGAEIWKLEGHAHVVRSVAFSPDGKLLASGSKDITVKLWRTDTWQLERTFEGHGKFFGEVAFSPDGKLLASNSHDVVFRTWDIATGTQQSGVVKGSGDDGFSVAFSPNGQLLAYAVWNQIILWDREETGRLAPIGIPRSGNDIGRSLRKAVAPTPPKGRLGRLFS